MMANADKNKNNSNDNYTQPEIKVKPAVISQSAIFEPTKIPRQITAHSKVHTIISNQIIM